ncbi:ABC-type cobalamin/Fe3+-siderophores transport system ATPase subunit [Chromohalobacter marismortui]|uniref:ABC-type cobalamin/Fe3+-siderophores transport system ATPase subunit n=1 Tax=Chromohalobacter marismortui TaxID=42055 RepID=A0A4R7NJJ0_9GAMM|nr:MULTISPECIES: ABC transporter ATP-binding protein [Chromohalobacter]MCI0511520.1 ABC transporter ATP-binding protein [Chromohalobacter sp.]MCI0594445.1 ABC transporter ATP-binding protein [Chromohalobacter sp.]TDU20461.1 ABC-type cobalamin/Fe3+-siderophores transport system ATPase subunit [Chromohalobacter marismortui]
MLSLFNTALDEAPRLVPFSGRLVPGELLGICGPHGAGKSTLIGLLAGLYRPTRGSICLDGQPLHCWPSTYRAQRIAHVLAPPQNMADWRIRDLIGLGLLEGCSRVTQHGASSPPCLPLAVETALKALDLQAMSDRPLGTLDPANAQRAMIARALCQVSAAPHCPCRQRRDNGILLLDLEPLAPDEEQRLLVDLSAVSRRHRLCIVPVVSQCDASLACCDRVWWMDAGTRCADLSPSVRHVLKVQVTPEPETSHPKAQDARP